MIVRGHLSPGGSVTSRTEPRSDPEAASPPGPSRPRIRRRRHRPSRPGLGSGSSVSAEGEVGSDGEASSAPKVRSARVWRQRWFGGQGRLSSASHRGPACEPSHGARTDWRSFPPDSAQSPIRCRAASLRRRRSRRWALRGYSSSSWFRRRCIRLRAGEDPRAYPVAVVTSAAHALQAIGVFSTPTRACAPSPLFPAEPDPNDWVDARILGQSAYASILVVNDKRAMRRCNLIRKSFGLGPVAMSLDDWLRDSSSRAA